MKKRCKRKGILAGPQYVAELVFFHRCGEDRTDISGIASKDSSNVAELLCFLRDCLRMYTEVGICSCSRRFRLSRGELCSEFAAKVFGR